MLGLDFEALLQLILLALVRAFFGAELARFGVRLFN